MATVNILFKRTLAQIGSVQVDATISETHTSEVEVTEHPVEVGANISDHAREKPDTLTLDCLISNTPLPDPSAALVKRQLNDSNGRPIGSATTRSGNDLARAGQAYQDLLTLKGSPDLVTVVTSLRSYTNMKVTNLTVQRDARTGQALRFTCTLKEVRLATSRTVAVQLPSKKKDKGPVAPKEAPKPVEDASTAKRLLDSVGGLQAAAKKAEAGISKITGFDLAGL